MNFFGSPVNAIGIQFSPHEILFEKSGLRFSCFVLLGPSFDLFSEITDCETGLQRNPGDDSKNPTFIVSSLCGYTFELLSSSFSKCFRSILLMVSSISSSSFKLRLLINISSATTAMPTTTIIVQLRSADSILEEFTEIKSKKKGRTPDVSKP